MVYKNLQISTYKLTLYTLSILLYTYIHPIHIYSVFQIIQYFLNTDDIDGKTNFRVKYIIIIIF